MPECTVPLLILLSPLVSTAAPLLPAIVAGSTGQEPPEDSLVLGVRVMVHTRPGFCLLTVLPLPSLLGHWL